MKQESIPDHRRDITKLFRTGSPQSAPTSINASPQFVVKVSKYCNLRCDYCYEFPHLGDKARMGLEQIQLAFQNIESSITHLAVEDINFIWHGGEPLLIPIEFYEQVALAEKDVFGTEFSCKNTVQTNLTVLTDRHLEFLKGGFFEDIGVSFDVYGDQRIDTKGKPRTDAVRAHMQKLLDHQIHFAAIAVLTRATLPNVKQIYRFFDELNLRHRILAYYKSADSGQAQRHGLDFGELVGAYKDIFHEWLASDQATSVDPIDDYVHFAVRHVTGRNNDRYDRSKSDRVFIIDVNGDVFNNIEPYEREFCYGNLFHSLLSDIVTSEGRARSIALSQDRMQRFCHRCPYFGSCPGTFVADATNVEREILRAHGCPVRRVLDHIVDVFERTDLQGLLVRTCTEAAHASAKENSALSVA
jgi:uncharacterized protein